MLGEKKSAKFRITKHGGDGYFVVRHGHNLEEAPLKLAPPYLHMGNPNPSPNPNPHPHPNPIPNPNPKPYPNPNPNPNPNPDPNPNPKQAVRLGPQP